MLNEIVNIDVHENEGKLVTTSRNIAKVFDKEHKIVLRDIRNLLTSTDHDFAGYNFVPFEYKDKNGENRPEYLLTRDGCMLLIMGYTGAKAMQLKTAYIKRFNEMEEALKKNALSLPNFSNPAEAARAWALEYEAKTKAIAERDEAIRTKSQIGSRREASAMGKASVAVRKAQKLELENNELKDRLGISKTYKQVKAIKFLRNYFNLSKNSTYSQIGKELSRISKNLNLTIQQIESEQFNKVNAYHIKAIEAFKAQLESDASFMGKYRK